MKLLIVGSGGREHALAWKLSQSPRVEKIYCAPGNGGTGTIATNVPIGALEVEKLRDFALSEKIDLTVIGPDDALALGLADLLEDAGLKVFGPRKAAAQLEASKVFTKEFLKKYGIPTAASEVFTDSMDAHQWCLSARYPLVLKADGLALGKGVLIAHNPEEAASGIYRIMDMKVFGAAGDRLLIEEFLEGVECSLHAFVDGKRWLLCPDARDHKRVGEGDTGPNTGGMGTISPSSSIDEKMRKTIEREILDRFIEGLAAEGIDFRGMLFPGLMLTAEGPKVLEFNCRFGDPETQVLVRRLESDLLDLLEATSQGRLDTVSPSWSNQTAACVVVASGGYPGAYEKGCRIEGLEAAGALPGVEVFHAGTAVKDNQLVSAGGRVLGVTATGTSLEEARARAYEGAKTIRFAGAYFRRDIGGSVL